MLRRNARLRREYMFRKQVEQQEIASMEKKRKIKQAITGLLHAFITLTVT